MNEMLVFTASKKMKYWNCKWIYKYSSNKILSNLLGISRKKSSNEYLNNQTT